MSTDSTSTAALSAALHAAMPISKLFIKDFSNCGCGAKFDLVIFSDKFAEFKLRIKRHQYVQDILADEIKKLHAITIHCCLSSEYEAKSTELVTADHEDCSVIAKKTD